jgi:hypothetical protein
MPIDIMCVNRPFRQKTGVDLVGIKDSVNKLFSTPGNEKFVHNSTNSIRVYVNGIRLDYVDDYTVTTSGPPGTGYDMVVLMTAPHSDDHITADYTIA